MIVSEALTWDAYKFEMAEYLDIPGGPDSHIMWQLLFEAAVNDADEYLNNDFTDDDGEDIDIPTLVKIGVYEWVRASTQMPVISGIKREKVGDLEAEFFAEHSMTYEAIYFRFWRPYRLLDWSEWSEEYDE